MLSLTTRTSTRKAYDTDFSIAPEKHSEYAILDGVKEVL